MAMKINYKLSEHIKTKKDTALVSRLTFSENCIFETIYGISFTPHLNVLSEAITFLKQVTYPKMSA